MIDYDPFLEGFRNLNKILLAMLLILFMTSLIF